VLQKPLRVLAILLVLLAVFALGMLVQAYLGLLRV
jgi:hypothetical protein